MNTRLLLVFGLGLVAAILLFAAGPIAASHQVLAWSGGCGWRTDMNCGGGSGSGDEGGGSGSEGGGGDEGGGG
jgi:hypothetical protein